MESYFLVNVVHNDFRAPEAIFAPFYRASDALTEKAKPPKIEVPNGVPMTNGHLEIASTA